MPAQHMPTARHRPLAKLGFSLGNVRLAKVKRPHGIAPFVAEYEVNMVRAGIEPFRPALLRRGFVEDSAGLFVSAAVQPSASGLDCMRGAVKPDQVAWPSCTLMHCPLLPFCSGAMVQWCWCWGWC